MIDIEKVTIFIKRYKLILLAGLLGVLFLSFIFNYRIINIAVEGDINGDLIITARPEAEIPSDELDFKLRSGLNIIRNQNLSVEAADDTKEATISVTPKLLGIASFTIPLTPQKIVDSLLYDSRHTTCHFRKDETGYGCLNNKLFRQQTDPAVQNKPVLPNIILVGKQQNYKQGILTIAHTGEPGERGRKPTLVYIASSGAKAIDRSIDRHDNISSLEIITTQTGDSFLLHDSSMKKIYHYSNINDSNPVEHSYIKDVEESAHNIEVSHAAGKIFLSASVNEAEETDDDHPDYSSYVWEFTVGGKSVERVAEYDISKITKAGNSSGDTFVVKDNLLGSLDRLGTLFLINTSDNERPSVVSRLYNVSGYTTSQDTVYYHRLGKVYSFNTSTMVSNLVRSIPGGDIRSLSVVDGSLALDIVSNSTRSINSIYVITDKPKESIDPFDVIPYNPLDLPIVSSRFHGDKIYIAVDLKSLHRPDGVTPSYDNTEYAQARQRITSRLKDDGLDISKYEVVFHPGVVMVENTILFSDEFTGDGVPPELQP